MTAFLICPERCRAAVFTVLTLLLEQACGEGPTADTPAITPQALQMVSGDQQSAISGAAIAAPLRVRVIGSDTRPLRGARVEWSVPEGLATLTPVQSTTDGSGEAETRVTMGSVTGVVRVNATIPELAPVSFALTAVEACRGTSAGTISFDPPVTGTLDPADCALHRGQFHDFYRFTLTAQQAVLISVRSVDFDPDVDLFTFEDQRDRGNRVDTVDARREAKLKAILAPGRYEVAASSADVGVTGPYTLRLSETSPSAEACEAVIVVRGITTPQQLGASDCVDDSGVFFGDVFGLWLTAGERVEFTHTSAEFAPLVQLYRLADDLVLLDQRGGSGTGTASLGYTAPLTGTYVVFATSDQMLGEGAYTLTVAEQPAATESMSSSASSQWTLPRTPHFDSRVSERSRHAWKH